jgi:hypothetical protein
MKRLSIIVGALALASNAVANTCSVRQAGATDQTVYVTFLDESTGVPTAGLAFDTSGIDLEYVRTAAAAVDITEATQTASGAHSDGGFVSVGHGRYRLDLPDAAVASGVPEVLVQGVITGYVMAPCTIALSPATNVVSFGGTAGTFSGGRPEVNASHAAGTAWTSGAITANSIASDAITAAKIAAAAIDAATFAADVDAEVLSYIVDDATRIDASDLNSKIDSLTFTVAGDVDVNVQTVGGAAITATGGRMETNTTHWGGTAVASATVNANTTQISGDSAAADALELHYDGTAGAVPGTGIGERGTAQAGAAGSITLRAGASAVDDYYRGGTIAIVAGTGAGQSGRSVSGYVGSTKVASTTPDWETNPDNTSVYELWQTAPGSGGSAPTAAEIVDEWETQSQADPTGFRVNVMEIGGTPQTANDNGADINEILVDTSTTLQGELDGIQADTEDLQTQIGTDGAGLTNVPWNASWDTEVQSEVDDALIAQNLDHLFTTTYDPASKPGAADALLNELVESDGGVSRFTVNALENGPSGSGASAEAIADEVETRTIAGVTTVTNLTNLPTIPADWLTAAGTAADFATEINTGMATQASVDDLPTNAELATSQAAADDATLAAIAALNNVSLTDIANITIEDQGSGISLRCALAIAVAYAAGDLATTAGTSTYEDPSGTETRIAGTVASAGNRAATITCPTY